MNVNDRIHAAAVDAVRGDVPGLPTDPGWCLTFVRVLIERALAWPSHTLYKWRTHPVTRPGGAAPTVPWARDMERSLKLAGMEVAGRRYGPPRDAERYVDVDEADLQPGDVLFRWDAAYQDEVPVGHVGLYFGHRLVLESVSPLGRPGALARDATVLSRLGFWPVTTVIRFDPAKAPYKEES